MSRQTMLERIPDYQVFLTVDELNEALIRLAQDYPKKVQVFEAGKSRAGHPVLCAKIGNGSRNALLYGCPHPNEPIGAMMSHYFARAIAEDDEYRAKLDFTFFIIPVADVDGVRLNEGWFKGPFTLYHYARNFFRPTGEEQVEWTFPMEYKNYSFSKPMPETKALMKIIDEAAPAFIYSLHNAGFGGAYWYISRAQGQSVYDALYASADGRAPLDLGEPEMPFAVKFSPAIYQMPRARDMYDYFEQYTQGDPADKMFGGECSFAYAGEQSLELVAELPYYYEPRVQSEALLNYTRAQAIEEKLSLQEKHIADLSAYYDRVRDFYSEDNLFAKIIKQTIGYTVSSIQGERAFIQKNPDFQNSCKESEAFSNVQMTKFYHLLNWGLMTRSAEYELAKRETGKNETLLAVQNEAQARLTREADDLERELAYRVIPIRDLVAVQLESGLQIMENMQPVLHPFRRSYKFSK